MAEPGLAPAAARRAPRSDRLTLALLVAAAFLAVLGLLSRELRDRPPAARRTAARVIVQRRVYETTVVERLITSSAGGGSTSAGAAPTVSQSVSGSSPIVAAVPAAPVTRSS